MLIQPKIDELTYYKELKDTITKDGKLLYAGRLLERGAQKFGDLPLLIFNDEPISYAELYRRACAFSAVLKQKGLKPRDRVIISFENAPEFYVAYFAVWQAGGVVAPVNTFLKEKELAHIVEDAKPTFIITSADRIELFKKADGPHLPPLLTPEDMPAPDDSFVPDEPIELDEHELAALLYTSGTTGVPKGVMLSSKNIMTNILQGVARLQIDYQERLFGVLPLFHVFAQNVCVWSALFIGATVILVPKIDRRYILSALKHKPTGFFGVPALYGLLCLLKTAPLDTVRFFVSGGDAMPDKIRSYFALLYRRKISNGYGLTETSPVLAFDWEDVAQPTGTIGKPVVGVELEIRNEQGKPLPQGQIGELWVKGDNVMLGYYNAPEETAKVLKDGWFNTGDMMYLSDEGKLIITGRTKDLIINKGINIYPQEIENVIMTHPSVIRAGVIGKHDSDGEVPIAYVQLREPLENSEKILKELCMQQLAPYKVPRQFICQVDELPLTATGKVDKKVLRKQIQ